MLKLLLPICCLIAAETFAQTPWMEPGRVYISTNQGLSWRRADEGFPKYGTVNTWIEKDKLICAGTEKHGIFIYSFRAAYWISASNGLPTDVKVDALVATGNKILAGTYRHGIYISDDNGQHWYASNRGLTDLTVKDIYVADGLILVGTDSGIYGSSNGGKEWVLLARGFQANIFTMVGHLIFAGTNRGLLKSIDSGRSWKPVYDKHAVLDVTADGETLFMKAHNEGIIKSADLGETWKTAHAGLPLTYMAKVIPLKEKLLVAEGIGVYESGDEGATWKLTGTGLIYNTSFVELLNSSVGVFVAAGLLKNDLQSCPE